MRGFGSSLEQISNKLLSAEAAVEVVKPGHRVFVPRKVGVQPQELCPLRHGKARQSGAWGYAPDPFFRIAI